MPRRRTRRPEASSNSAVPVRGDGSRRAARERPRPGPAATSAGFLRWEPMIVVSKLKSSELGIGAPKELVSSGWNPAGGGAFSGRVSDLEDRRALRATNLLRRGPREAGLVVVVARLAGRALDDQRISPADTLNGTCLIRHFPVPGIKPCGSGEAQAASRPARAPPSDRPGASDQAREDLEERRDVGLGARPAEGEPERRADLGHGHSAGEKDPARRRSSRRARRPGRGRDSLRGRAPPGASRRRRRER